MAKRIRKAYETLKYLNIDGNFERFMREFLPYLQNNLQLIQVRNHVENYEFYSCGQPHNPRNPAWQPFQNMETFCRKKRCDFETVKGMIEERLFKRLKCECELLTNTDDLKRKGLERSFGLDFGKPGRREFDIV